ncbi:MAG: hypothetical protein IT256_08305 [Chitinophagaceae bacterium]|nr:hypothetical protein [Chitinophagaceae bacterium]
MQDQKNRHSFHIPVMGLAFTIDSPIKVAHYGISATLAIGEDDLMENMREYYCKLFQIPFASISKKLLDHRAKRVTAYLDMMQTIVLQKFEQFKKELSESKTTIEHYIALLPNKSELKKKLQAFLEEGTVQKESIKNYLEKNLPLGDIDVNIMTKVDRDNYVGEEKLPIDYNDAHAALRGFANSVLQSSVVLSAGLNPRLYSYFEQFPVFFPDEAGFLEKKITLKVSDYRSALIQGNFLAKKGLWVSEYRIESGLNCGGHAFATDGFLMGPILQEFKDKRQDLIQSTHELMCKALATKQLPVPAQPLPIKVTAQGGVGTAEEHEFLLAEYQLDSIGWGSPFLLVPEATTVDDTTRQLLADAQESDFYLSNISPLGVPFNSVKGVSNDFWKQKRINDNKPGSACPKKFLALDYTYDAKGMCTASRKFQDLAIEKLGEEKETLSNKEYEIKHNKITEKACLCVGLSNTTYLEKGIATKGQQQGVLVCPGPNLAYFHKVVSLKDMVGHIYGNTNILKPTERPHMFIKELKMYVDYLRNELDSFSGQANTMQLKKWNAFKNNLQAGIAYYQDLFQNTSFFKDINATVQNSLVLHANAINAIAVPQ